MALDLAQVYLQAKDLTGDAFGSFKRNTREAGDSVSRLQGILAGLGVSLSAGAFVVMVKSTIDALDRMNDLTRSTGLAVEALSGLQLVARKSGSDLDATAFSVRKLSENMAKDEAKFRALGISAKDPLEAFKQLGDVFVAIKDPQLRAAVAAEALGKSWAGAAPLLSEGGRKIGEMIERGKQLSGQTQEMAQRADEFNDRLAEFNLVLGSVKTRMVGDMLPGLQEITQAIQYAYEESGKLQAVWVALGGVGAFLFTNEFQTVRSKINDLRAEIASMEEHERRFAASGLRGDIDAIAAQIDAKKEELAALLKSIEPVKPPPGNSAADAAAAEAAKKFLKLQESAEKERLAMLERYRKLDVDGWVKYIDALNAEYEDALKEQAKLDDEFWKRKEDLRAADLKAMFDMIDAEQSAAIAEGEVLAQEITENHKQLEALQKNYVDMWADVDRVAHDTFVSIFDSGKSSFDRLRDTLKNGLYSLLYQMTLRPFLINVVTSTTGSSVAQQAFGVSGGIDSLLSGAGNLNSVFGGAGLFGSAGAYSLAAGAGAEQAAMLAAQTGVFGAEGLAATAGASGAMTTLAAAAPYVAAAVAVASALGVFGGGGGGPAHFTGLDVSGMLGPQGMLSSSWLAHSANSDTNFSWATHDQGATGGINAAIQNAFTSMAQIATQLGIDPARLNSAQIPFSFHSYDTSGAGGNPTTQGVINDFTASLGQITDQLAQQLVPNLASFAQAGETATQTLLRLVQVQDQLRQQEMQQTDQLKGLIQGLPGQLGITSLRQFQDSLKVADTLAPLDRLANAKTLLNDTYTRAMQGDLSAVSAFPNSAQQLLSIGRDTYASGSQYQQLFVEINRELQDVLSLQTAQQADLLKNIDVSIVSSAQEQTAELQKIRKAIDDMNASLQATQAELRRIAA